MNLKSFLVILLVGFFSLIFISAQECNTGEVVGDEYCDEYGLFKILKQGGENCLNNYECVEGSCIEGLCQSKFPSFQERSDILQDVWYVFSGEECDPEYDTDYHCIGTIAYLCGENYVWEEKGEIPGVCGVSTNGNGNGGYRINILIFSPRDDVTYSYREIPLQVVDTKNKARYWRYSLNDGEKVEFTPNTTISVGLGANSLEVYASRYSSFASEKMKSVDFSVVSSDSGSCGDGICSNLENSNICAEDCAAPPVSTESYCGDGVCDNDESSATCPGDCPAKPRNDFTWLFWVLLILVIILIAVVGFLLYKRLKAKKEGKKPPIAGKKIPPKAPPTSVTPVRRVPPRRPLASSVRKTPTLVRRPVPPRKKAYLGTRP